MQESRLSVVLAQLYNSATASELVLREEINRAVILLFEFAEAVVQKYKAARTADQEKNPNFRFWSHTCSVEKGVTAVTVRWRQYSGKSKFSTPIDANGLVEFKLPAKAFRTCTKNEKKAILEAERGFGIVRKISWHLGKSIESVRAVQAIANISLHPQLPPVDAEEKRILDALEELDCISREHAKLDRAAVRRLLSL